MKNKLTSKIIIITILIFINFAVVGLLDIFNLHFTDYVKNEIVEVDELNNENVSTILLDRNEKDEYEFLVESSKKESVSIVYEDTHSKYRIFANKKLKIQNYDESLIKYDDNTSYSIFDIKEDDYNNIDGKFIAEIKLIKNYKTIKLNDKVLFFIGNRNKIIDFLLFRTGYDYGIAMCFFIIFIISGVVYYKYKTSYMFITLLISFISVLKSIIVGKLNIFGSIQGNIFYYDTLAGVINFFLCQLLFYDLFQIKFKKRYVFLYSCIFFLFEMVYIFSYNTEMIFIMHLIGSIVIMAMGIKAYFDCKKYSMIMMISYSIFSGTVVYRFLITLGVFERGYFSAAIPSPQIGNLIYILGFLFSVIMVHFNKLKDFEVHKKNYEKMILLRGISHDLKLPLSIIKLNIQMMEKYEMSSEEIHEYADASLKATFELEEMTRNISDYLNANSISNKGYLISFKERLESIEIYYENYGKDKNIKFLVDMPDKDFMLPINPLNIDRILYNLIDNAFKYTEENGTIKVSGKLDGNVVITVEDNGIGMENKFTEKIFEPFYRIDKSRNDEGTGLGLSIVQSIVESLGGSVEVNSKLGKGTRVTVSFPVI